MTEKVSFVGDVKQDLRNYIDLAILQTLKDARDGNDGPLQIAPIPLFKGDQKTKTIDRLDIAESIMIPLLYGIGSDCKTKA